jgi:hypothetical protein
VNDGPQAWIERREQRVQRFLPLGLLALSVVLDVLIGEADAVNFALVAALFVALWFLWPRALKRRGGWRSSSG